MGKASRRKQLKRAGLLEEKPKGEARLECACQAHASRVVDFDLANLPEEITRESAWWAKAWEGEGEEKRRERW